MPDGGAISPPATKSSFDVGRVEDLDDGVFRLVRAGGREIGIVRWRGEVFAVRNVCPHIAGPVCTTVRLHLVAEPAGLSPCPDADKPVIVCAWHKWEFELRSGRAVSDRKLRVKTYPTEVRPDGSIWVTV